MGIYDDWYAHFNILSVHTRDIFYILTLLLWLLFTAMWAANFVCVGMIKWWGRGGQIVGLGQIWWALAAFMGTQVLTGILRYQSKTGVWKVLRSESDSSN